MAERTFETIQQAVEAVGNSFDAKGQKLSPDMVLQMWERMQLSFDSNGEWQRPTIVVHPDLGERARAILRAIDEEPELRARRDKIVNRQRDEWRVREASRKLVD